MSSTGSFGLLKPRYSIAGGRVIIARNVWLPFVLVGLAVPGVVALSAFFSPHGSNAGVFLLGFSGVMLALFALVMTPWLAPGKIVCSPAGLQWGSRTFPPERVQQIDGDVMSTRVQYRGTYQSWFITVEVAKGSEVPAITNARARKASLIRLTLSLGNRSSGSSSDALGELVQAMKAALHGETVGAEHVVRTPALPHTKNRWQVGVRTPGAEWLEVTRQRDGFCWEFASEDFKGSGYNFETVVQSDAELIAKGPPVKISAAMAREMLGNVRPAWLLELEPPASKQIAKRIAKETESDAARVRELLQQEEVRRRAEAVVAPVDDGAPGPPRPPTHE